MKKHSKISNLFYLFCTNICTSHHIGINIPSLYLYKYGYQHIGKNIPSLYLYKYAYQHIGMRQHRGNQQLRSKVEEIWFPHSSPAFLSTKSFLLTLTEEKTFAQHLKIKNLSY